MDRRILEAATHVILEQGYGRATMEHIADVARAGKTTLYSRYPTKADLFAAVVINSGGMSGLSDLAPPTEGPLRDRLVSAGNELADVTLTEPSIALMRATLAETDTFPDVALKGFRLGFDDCARHMARALAGTTDNDRVDDAMPQARRFVELALHPLYMHAFFGTDLAGLRQRAKACVEEVADHFVASPARP